jgi:hypothetical protein
MRRRAAAALRAACLALLVAAAAAGKDLYSVLGISRGADEATIKKNYHKLALCVARAGGAGVICKSKAGGGRMFVLCPGGRSCGERCVCGEAEACCWRRRKWHPDKNPTNKEAAEAQFREARARGGCPRATRRRTHAHATHASCTTPRHLRCQRPAASRRVAATHCGARRVSRGAARCRRGIAPRAHAQRRLPQRRRSGFCDSPKA